MDHVVGQRYIFAVAQLPFESASQTGVYNQFCTLLPLFDSNKVVANPHDFPDKGDVWWMVQPGVRGLAEPSRLVTGLVEESVKKGQSGLAQYQVAADSVEPVRGRDYVEVIDVPATVVSKPRDLVGSGFRLEIDHVPLDTAVLRWNGFLWGRFRTKSEPSEEAGHWRVRFSPESSDSVVYKVSQDILEYIAKSDQLTTTTQVSLERRPPYDSRQLAECRYHLIEADALDRSLPSGLERVSLRTDQDVIRQLAKRLLSRNKRQNLMNMIDELDELARQSDPREAEERETLEAIKQALGHETRSLQGLADSIVSAGLIEDHVNEAIHSRVKQHIDAHAAKLQSEVNKRVVETRNELELLTQEKEQLESDVSSYRTRERRKLEQELDKRRQEFDASLRKEQEAIEKQLAELKRQQNVLSNNLAEVGKTLGEKRDEVVNQFLAIVPLLTQLGLLPGKGAESGKRMVDSPEPAPSADRGAPSETEANSFHIPAFYSASSGSEITEAEFFERFVKHVEACGFRYRKIDLLAFHVSVKCGSLTILGGLPGTGKSSLSRLYADAIRGADRSDPERFLHVPVSPSWLDMRDLIGHVNALNKTFQPADSSLYQQLLYAQEENKEIGDDSCLHFVCLDEMNLSHVEHYFSGLLQVLEFPEGLRRLQCFPDNVVDPDSAFARYSSLVVPHSVRFIGTVNFDETTKQLSQRLLDRANLILLPSNQLPLEFEESPKAEVAGPPVRLRDYRRWTRRTASYSDELADLVDELREDLRVLNCPMNPRRFSAMRKFLASWPEDVAPSEQAIDSQLAQRVLPQIRGLFQPGARAAVDSIRKKLERHPNSFTESLRVLDEICNAEHSDIFFDSESP